MKYYILFLIGFLVLSPFAYSQVSVELDLDLERRKDKDESVKLFESVALIYLYAGDEIEIDLKLDNGSEVKNVALLLEKVKLNLNSPSKYRPFIMAGKGSGILTRVYDGPINETVTIESEGKYHLSLKSGKYTTGNLRVIRRVKEPVNFHKPTKIYTVSYEKGGETFYTTELEYNSEAGRIHSEPLNKETVEEMLSLGAGINDRTLEGRGLLHIAVEKNDIAFVDYLLKKNVNPNIKDNSGKAPIHLIKSGENDIDIASLLMKHGADVNASDEEGNLPVHYATESGNFGLFKLLIANGADVRVTNEKGETPLILSSDIRITRQLISMGVPLNVEGQHLFDKILCKDKETVKLLIEHGARYSHNPSYRIPLRRDCVYEDRELATLLIEAGADVNQKGLFGSTPLHFAVQLATTEEMIGFHTGDADFAKFLIKEGADIHARDDFGRTPLFTAVYFPSGNYELIKLLLEKNANVNARDKEGNTPLFIGLEVVGIKMLLDNGADVNAQNLKGQTPLHVHVSRGNKEVARLLMKSGANPKIRDHNKQTALKIARKIKDKEMKGILKNKL